MSMADKKILKTTIKLRRDTVNNYASHGSHVPLKGEVCIVDPTATAPWAVAKAIRFKIGDGVTTWSNLPFYDQQNSSVFCGYYYNGKFYGDVSHTAELTEPEATVLYVDLHGGAIYYYENGEYKANKVEIPSASETQPGIVKLYQKLGYNADGTMSQKAITEAIDEIELKVSTEDAEALYLAKPEII